MRYSGLPDSEPVVEIRIPLSIPGLSVVCDWCQEDRRVVGSCYLAADAIQGRRPYALEDLSVTAAVLLLGGHVRGDRSGLECRVQEWPSGALERLTRANAEARAAIPEPAAEAAE